MLSYVQPVFHLFHPISEHLGDRLAEILHKEGSFGAMEVKVKLIKHSEGGTQRSVWRNWDGKSRSLKPPHDLHIMRQVQETNTPFHTFFLSYAEAHDRQCQTLGHLTWPYEKK